MSRIVNLKTIRFNIFNIYDSWYSSWYEDINYSSLLHEDLMLKNYLIGIFYKLKVPTNYFFFKRNTNNTLFIYTDLFFIKYYKKSMLKFLFKEQFYYFSYLIKLFIFYKSYFYSSILLENKSSLSYFFSEKKIRQTTFIGTTISIKLKNILLFNNIDMSNIFFYIKNNGISVELLLLFLNSKSFFDFKNKYMAFCMASFFLIYNNSNYVLQLKLNYYYLILINKLVVLLIFLFKHFSLMLLKNIVSFFLSIKQNISLVGYKNNASFSNYLCLIKKFDVPSIKIFNKREYILLYIISNIRFFYILIHLHFFNNLNIKLFTQYVNIVICILSLNNIIIFSKKKIFDFFLNSFIQKKQSFSLIKYLKLKYYRMSYIYTDGNFKKRVVKKILNSFFTTLFLKDFFYKLEKGISNYTKQKAYLFFNVFFLEHNVFPSITNAKIITDFVVYNIHNQINIRTIFKKIRNWQMENNENKKYLEHLSYLYKAEGVSSEYLNHFSFKRYPIMGIRIECSGTAKKGTRKQKIFYGDWIKDFDQNTKSPNNTFSADLDYYQSFAIVKSSTLGIKVWVFFKTHLYNSNNVFISLISY